MMQFFKLAIGIVLLTCVIALITARYGPWQTPLSRDLPPTQHSEGELGLRSTPEDLYKPAPVPGSNVTVAERAEPLKPMYCAISGSYWEPRAGTYVLGIAPGPTGYFLETGHENCPSGLAWVTPAPARAQSSRPNSPTAAQWTTSGISLPGKGGIIAPAYLCKDGSSQTYPSGAPIDVQQICFGHGGVKREITFDPVTGKAY